MARIIESTKGGTAFQRLLGHNEGILERWTKLGDMLEREGRLSSHLKEQVRRTLAQENGCEYCKAKGKPDPYTFNEKISVAVGFAEVFNKQKGNIPDSIFGVLSQHFTDEEISELIAYISFATASQYYGALMKLQAN
ncbi:alkylhydroperoxidase [Fictibacillus phosphorivorans]|uniref:Alkylhydroperoxidase n=1 Tax=Fictibacillus phosphorivorans TaxID=1221500 RepID=A0A160IN97_9BACL|nr:carboxymuconolactone decarboxylase family protein [Fictibacillus phosphorivorans]ANC77466.1 alkylhydroperoxidase [Fictibacillus phosphorivorans]